MHSLSRGCFLSFIFAQSNKNCLKIATLNIDWFKKSNATKQKIIDEFTKQNKASENKQQRIVTQDDKMFTLKPTFSSNNLRK